MVRGQLEDYLFQLLSLIAAEVNAYPPRFVQAQNSYHPCKGQASAVGADAAFAETATDYMDAAMVGMSLDSWS